MHAKFDEFGVLARLFVPDLAGPRALPVAPVETRCGFASVCMGCFRCRGPRWWR